MQRLAVVALTVAGVLLLASPASAAVSHAFLPSFDGSETPAKSFGGASGVAVDQSGGDVYVADITNNVVDKFDALGKYLCQITGSSLPSLTECNGIAGSETPAGSVAFSNPAALAVDNATAPADPSLGDIYVVDGGHGACLNPENGICGVIDKFSAAGAYLGQVGGPFPSSLFGVGVDASGNVWVYDSGSNIYEFDSSGTSVFQFNAGIGGAWPAFAVDSNGNTYPAFGQLSASVEKFDSAGHDGGLLEKFCTFCQVGIATDLSTDDVYVDDETFIAEYNSAKEPLVQFGQAQLTSGGQGGIAVNPVTGTIYVANATDAKVYVFGPSPGPRVAPQAASNVQTTTATLNATVNPEGAATKYQFEYGASRAYGQSAPASPADAGSGSSPVAASAGLTELEGGTTYHYRIVASNANGSVTSADRTFTTLPVPVIDAAFVSDLSASSATLNAKIDPKGADTKYHFEFGTSTEYGSRVPAADEDIGEGTSDVSRSQTITLPRANTLYHWRVVAVGVNGTTISPDHTFIYPTEGVSLPDGRAYEMVSPAQKNGSLLGDVFLGEPPEVSSDGSRVITSTIQCFSGAESCPAQRASVGSPYEFSRSSAGWRTTALAPSGSQFQALSALSFSADAGTALFTAVTPPHGEDDFYARRADGSLIDIGPLTPPSAGRVGNGTFNRSFVTGDLSRLVWETGGGTSHWPFDETSAGSRTVYEYAGAGNAQPLMVGVSGGAGSTDLIGTCSTELSGSAPGTLSANGLIVYFVAVGGKACLGSGANKETPVPVAEVFARVDNAQPDARTVAISEPQAPQAPSESNEACESTKCKENTEDTPTGIENWRDARFYGASQDGSKAFFASTQQLTDTASQDPLSGDSASATGCTFTSGANGCNLYEYDFASAPGRRLIDVSAGDSGGGGPRVQGAIAVSTDGSHVYFVARGVLTTSANARSQSAQSGAENLYVFERDGAHPNGRVAFIAALPAADAGEWEHGVGNPANVGPDGRFLVFTSSGRLTADDTSVGGAQQVFRYDAQSGELIRISIGNEGFNDNGNRSSATPCGGEDCSEDARIARVRGSDPSDRHRLDPTMSDDGAYVFFESPLALAAGALEDVPIGTEEHGSPIYAQNVYEYHEGHVYLISDGRDVSQDHSQSEACGGTEGARSSTCLLGSDATGSNVFFSTADQLVGQDTDTELDYYDARICTASDPCIKLPTPPLPCEADACQGPQSPQPPVPLAASVSFSGPGNASPGNTIQLAKVKILSHVVHGARFLLSVAVPAKGRIAISGARVKGVSRSLTHAGTYRFVVALTAKARAALHRKHGRPMTVHVHIAYAPAAGAGSAANVTFTVKG